MHYVIKTYQDLPAAHRQPYHDGHCRLLHGHSWRFDLTFTCAELDENGFVVDMGKLEKVKDFLVDHFDHTLLLNKDDPNGVALGRALGDLSKIVVVPNCGMEGLARFVYEEVGVIISSLPGSKKRELRVIEVTCWEDSKNRATYRL